MRDPNNYPASVKEIEDIQSEIMDILVSSPETEKSKQFLRKIYEALDIIIEQIYDYEEALDRLA